MTGLVERTNTIELEQLNLALGLKKPFTGPELLAVVREALSPETTVGDSDLKEATGNRLDQGKD